MGDKSNSCPYFTVLEDFPSIVNLKWSNNALIYVWSLKRPEAIMPKMMRAVS